MATIIWAIWDHHHVFWRNLAIFSSCLSRELRNLENRSHLNDWFLGNKKPHTQIHTHKTHTWFACFSWHLSISLEHHTHDHKAMHWLKKGGVTSDFIFIFWWQVLVILWKIFCNKFSGVFFFGKKVSLKNRFFWLKNHENLSQLHGCLRFFLLHFLDISNFG